MSMEPNRVSSLLVLFTTTIIPLFCSAVGEHHKLPGKWELLTSNCGISAMHMQLLPDNNVIIFDWTRRGPSNISLPPNGKCDNGDCTAHSVEFNLVKKTVRPLYIVTNTWCSSGSLSSRGVLIQTGGTDLGFKVTRYFKPFVGGDWIEHPNGLLVPRWYASNQILPNGKIIVVGGRDQFNYEFVPKSKPNYDKLHPLKFLDETMYHSEVEDNLYPFLHLSPDGNLFIFANDRAILLDYVKNRVVRTYSVLPGRVSRNYPSTGSSVLLPIRLSSKYSSSIPDAEVLVCGGSWPNAFNEADKKNHFVGASKTCGRLMITEENPNWVIEEMPTERIMGDMILLPTGDVLIVNGAKNGSAGWNYARSPVLNPALYHSDFNSKPSRFEVMSASNRPRMYHSTALLIPDGRVLVAGSNSHKTYNFSSLYPTDLSIEAFSPPYLTSKTHPRPRINWIKPGVKLVYGRKFSVGVDLGGEEFNGRIDLTMVAPSFTTHSFSMNQRVLFLAVDGVEKKRNGGSVIKANAPATAALAPPGYYLLFVVGDGVPSTAIWVHIRKR
ncbi:putative Galactose oxidase precursor [Tripterygium wilfordii]|uniref:Putative Galactose oxidase n=1 Tax=Tripterygium wilfordii TaxID=458696 RepID=A0A7J7CLK4_TRIWF|nr:aldehyde oxidase GLOX1-like [Tripterygium wilfordii]KAF5734952.1 putative Galactose oxidase precursor [Tripterygium wilfordii]